MRVPLHLLALVLPLLLIGAPMPPAAHQPSGVTCADRVGERLAAVSTRCVDLVPVPELRGVRGIVEIRTVVSEFGTTVTRDGALRRALAVELAGLPEPDRHTPGARAWVAWIASLSMDSVVRLGPVANGRTALGETTRENYRILISAEPSAQATVRTGRPALRASSPGARLLAHRDMTSPAAPGMPRALGTPTPGAGSHVHDAPRGTPVTDAWAMPPVPAWMRPMTMSHPPPATAPWLPATTLAARLIDPTTLPMVRPSAPVVLAPGDTLRLAATLVRRIINGRTVVTYGFNGQHPGPSIRVAQGTTIVVEFENRIDQPTAVHWHGVRLENRSDGAVGVTQAAVPPGGRYTYRVHFRDAGIYWYHPHQREDVQQDLGLVGSMLVAPRARGHWNPVDREELLLLDDLLLGADGGVYPYGADAATHALMGRVGNLHLVNGAPDHVVTVRRGQVVRFYLTNASAARTYNVVLGDLQVKVVGTDLGRFERERWAPSIVIAPAERYVVEVRFDQAGTVPITNRIRALDHMSGWIVPVVDTLATIRVVEDGAPASPFGAPRARAEVTAELAPHRRHARRAPDRELALEMRMGQVPAGLAAMLWGQPVPIDWNDGMPVVNWLLTSRDLTWVIRDRASDRKNMDVRWRFRVGDLVKIRIHNTPLAAHAMAHPIHVHGQRFLVLSRNGVPSDNLAWKDTAIIPVDEAVDLLVEMSNPGRWMLHCHIAEHLGAGMMMVFDVEARGRPSPRSLP